MKDLVVLCENTVKLLSFDTEEQAKVYGDKVISVIREITERATGEQKSILIGRYFNLRIEFEKNKYVLSGDLIIKNVTVVKGILENNQILSKAYYIYYIHALLFDAINERKDHQGRQELQNISRSIYQGGFSEITDVLVSKLSIVDQLIHMSDIDIQGKIKKLDEIGIQLGLTLSGTQERLDKIEGKISREIDDIAEKASANLKFVENEIADMRASAAEKAGAMLKSVEGEVLSIKAIAIEKAKFEIAEGVWNDKARRHRTNSQIGLSFILLMLFGSVVLFWLMWGGIKSEYLEVVKLSNGLVSVPLFAAPAVALAWALRIINKVVINELSLSDDAHQRAALLRTYYRLVGDESAKMQQGDRLLVLNALFRPLPGHQNEEVSPPNFSDLLKEMIGKKD